MRSIVIQPPFVQLNAPYPAIWYLDAFLRSLEIRSDAYDDAIECYRAIFSKKGLGLIFSRARILLEGRKHPDKETARRAKSYLEQEDAYKNIIDGLCGFLSGGDPAFGYRLAVGAGVPHGMRTEAVLGEAGGIAPDDARALATAVLSDLGDFIRYAIDPNFGTVRYAEGIPASSPNFAPLLATANGSWLLDTFYRPMLRARFGARSDGGYTPTEVDPLLACITVPFPGCFTGAIVAAQELRAHFGKTVKIVLGGGYVSTELRFLEDPAPFELFDWLAYDGGYGPLLSILDVIKNKQPETALFRVRRLGAGDRVEARGFDLGASGCVASINSDKRDESSAGEGSGYSKKENDAIARVHPDYLGADFGRYLRIVDSPNPMHRLWNDTPWLKYRLAYGCYWSRCAFCDTQLHYINHYEPVDLQALLLAASSAGERTGLYGIHFTDEAMPPALVRAFAAENEKRARPFTFWGNVRFDLAWTEELCSYAAERGLVAVSGGIEIATGTGLEIVDKGFTLTGLVRTLSNFKRAGILVHAYLIYGFPGQSDKDIADSAEMVRVLLAEGLIDSGFWHRFVLTRHSRLYADWERGACPDLDPKIPESTFALNDLRFRGEERYEKWTAPLDAAMAAWSDSGETDTPLSAFLPRDLPRPRIDAMAVLDEAGVRRR